MRDNGYQQAWEALRAKIAEHAASYDASARAEDLRSQSRDIDDNDRRIAERYYSRFDGAFVALDIAESWMSEYESAWVDGKTEVQG